MKWSRVSASVWLRFCLQFLHDLHPLEIHHTDRVVVSVRGVELLEFRDVFHAFDTGSVRYCRNNFVCAEIDDVRLSSGEMRG